MQNVYYVLLINAEYLLKLQHQKRSEISLGMSSFLLNSTCNLLNMVLLRKIGHMVLKNSMNKSLLLRLHSVLLGLVLSFDLLSLSACAANQEKPTAYTYEQQLSENEGVAESSSNQTWTEQASEVILNALSLSGVQYKYGGSTPESGFDCSGFVRYVFKQATNLTLPRSALAISQLGKNVRNNDLQPGDLVFFNTLKSTFSHVGIYLGNNKFIHSPSRGGGVRVEDMKDQYWSKRYNGARRIGNEGMVAKEP